VLPWVLVCLNCFDARKPTQVKALMADRYSNGIGKVMLLRLGLGARLKLAPRYARWKERDFVLEPGPLALGGPVGARIQFEQILPRVRKPPSIRMLEVHPHHLWDLQQLKCEFIYSGASRKQAEEAKGTSCGFVFSLEEDQGAKTSTKATWILAIDLGQRDGSWNILHIEARGPPGTGT
jgi:hypothetical protein